MPVAALPTTRLIAEFSAWSANLLNLAADLERINGHADVLHIDVADGHFAPAFLFFPDQVAAIRKASNIPIHVHLMCADKILLAQIEQFAEAGANIISVHAENGNAAAALAAINAKGLAAGLVLKVDTPVARAKPFLRDLQFLTLLGTAIGVKGQSLDPAACDRLGEARRMIAAAGVGHRIVLAADGGIRENTVPELRKAGAAKASEPRTTVSAPDLATRMAWLKGL
jgi:ribulose-phosphate 3-epimerase